MNTQTLVSVEEYFDLLHQSEIKLEYNAGEIVAMAGAQAPHNILTANITMELINCLRKRGCIILSSDQLIKVEACEKYTFPDLVVVCQKPIYEKSPQGLDALLNPEIIVEILSDSTQSYDRTEKFDCYKTLASFREYVLVSSKKYHVEVHKKLNDAEWLSHTYSHLEEKIKIDACEILLQDLYYGIEFT